MSGYSTALTGCLEHKPSFVDVWFCVLCQIGYQANAPEGKPGCCGAAFCLSCCCGQATICTCCIRMKVSERYQLGESVVWSCLLSHFCISCSLCQTYREMNNHGLKAGGVCVGLLEGAGVGAAAAMTAGAGGNRAAPAGAKFEVVNAWYGTEETHTEGGAVVEKIRESVNQHGKIVIPGAMNNFFGHDPVPNVVKVVAIHVRYNGGEEHLRGHEGTDFSWAPPAPQIDIINAWYGTEETHTEGGVVVEKIRESVQQNGHIVIPGAMNAFFGHDPVPNVVKVVAIHVRCNGKEEHLRGHEGTDFSWSG